MRGETTNEKTAHGKNKDRFSSLQLFCFTLIALELDPQPNPIGLLYLLLIHFPLSSKSMASLLPSLSIPISSFHPSPAVRLPHARGLKVSFSSPLNRSSASRAPSVSSRAGRIVCEAQETAVEVLAVTDKTWNSLVLESESAVLVEFWAPWCGPCRMIHPVIDSLAGEYAGKLKCYKLNTDESPSIATQYGIRSIPTVMIFKGGEKKDAIIGAVPKTTLTSSIEKFL